MSEKDLREIVENQFVDEQALEQSKRVDKRRDIAYKVGKRGAQLTMKAATTAASSAASTAASAGSASGILAALGGTAVAAPPFSTIIAVVAGVGISVGLAVTSKRRKKFLSQDEKLLNKLIKKYKKKSTAWRKKKIVNLLADYNALLAKGNKTKFRKKLKKDRFRWKVRKSKLEMKLKALYGAQYEDSFKKAMKGIKSKKKISKKQAIAEQSAVKKIKTNQANSIDPRTSPFPLIAPGEVGITPKLMKADAIESQQSDVQIIKLSKAPDGLKEFEKMKSDEEVHKEAVKEIMKPDKKPISPLLITIPLLLIGTTGFIVYRRYQNE